MDRMRRKEQLIKALAKYLSHDMGKKSILLEMGDEDAKVWAEVRDASGIMGYADEGETEKHLKELLG